MASGRTTVDLVIAIVLPAATVYWFGWTLPFIWTRGRKGRGGGRWLFSTLPPPWWPYWGWGWRAYLRGGPVAGTGVLLGLSLGSILHLFERSYVVGWLTLPPMIASWVIALVIALWARPKKLIPPWARAQSGAVREWADWWKLRRPGQERG